MVGCPRIVGPVADRTHPLLVPQVWCGFMVFCLVVWRVMVLRGGPAQSLPTLSLPSLVQTQPPLAPGPRDAIGREGVPEAAPEAVGQAVGGGCRSGWGQLLSVTNAVEAGTWREGWGVLGGGGGHHTTPPGPPWSTARETYGCRAQTRNMGRAASPRPPSFCCP